MPTRRKSNESKDEKLNQLLRMKRLERPSKEFWDGFEQELRSKQLTALVKTQSWYSRLGRLSLIVGKKSIAVVATTGALAIAFFAVPQIATITSTPETGQEILTVQSIEQEPSTPLFVVEESKPEIEFQSISDSLPKIDGSAVYRVNVLAQPQQPESFTLVSSPKSFILDEESGAAKRNSGEEFGARIIRAGQRF